MIQRTYLPNWGTLPDALLRSSGNFAQRFTECAKGDFPVKVPPPPPVFPGTWPPANQQQSTGAPNGTFNAIRGALVLSLTATEWPASTVSPSFCPSNLFSVDFSPHLRNQRGLLLSFILHLFASQSTLSSLRTSVQNIVASIKSAIQVAVSGQQSRCSSVLSLPSMDSGTSQSPTFLLTCCRAHVVARFSSAPSPTISPRR